MHDILLLLLLLLLSIFFFPYSNSNEAKKIHSLADQARNTSLEAYNLAKKAITKYSNISDEIRDLGNKLELLEDLFNEVKNLTNIAAEKSAVVSKEALQLWVLELSVPIVNIEQLRSQVESVSKNVSF